MLTIKLKRIGKKKNPLYNIIAIEKSSFIKGKYIEKLGYFDPIKNISKIKIDKIEKWIKTGAYISKRVNNLIKIYKNEKNISSNK